MFRESLQKFRLTSDQPEVASFNVTWKSNARMAAYLSDNLAPQL